MTEGVNSKESVELEDLAQLAVHAQSELVAAGELQVGQTAQIVAYGAVNAGAYVVLEVLPQPGALGLLFAKWAYEEDRPFWAEAAKVSREFMKKSSHPKTGMSPEYAEFDGSPVTKVFEWGRHDWFYSDAYRTAANIGLDYAWFQTDVGQTQAVSRLQYTLGVVNKENPYMTYEVDGTVLDQEALHPVGLLATTAEGSLAVLKDPVQQEMINSAEKELALWWVKKFWETPLRTGKRRYYDNCLYMFAFLALAGKYRTW